LNLNPVRVDEPLSLIAAVPTWVDTVAILSNWLVSALVESS